MPEGVEGLQTGDLVRVEVPTGRNAGVYVGRMVVWARGYFDVQTATGIAWGIHIRFCLLLQRAGGYGYAIQQKPR